MSEEEPKEEMFGQGRTMKKMHSQAVGFSVALGALVFALLLAGLLIVFGPHELLGSFVR